MVCLNSYLWVLRYTSTLYVTLLVLCPPSQLTSSASAADRATHLGYTIISGIRKPVQGLYLRLFQFFPQTLNVGLY